ncbi:hypothetical protein BZA05DRAFT_422678 [Tricharina praecox]|uniref:uncharacterized protein n=1 Tax=Tricharina praecox TaxID=43433 RepID=UPI00221F935F|nr:uncharacterized protein BZA05DRAFT_422678 [Tricharina praecox]KAI5842050.1 hypothetical protein BZA05DRAFT_422678 [Tricharina praecox]
MENNEVIFPTKILLTTTDNNIGLIARQRCLQGTVSALSTHSVDASSVADLVGALMADSVSAFLLGSVGAFLLGSVDAFLRGSAGALSLEEASDWKDLLERRGLKLGAVHVEKHHGDFALVNLILTKREALQIRGDETMKLFYDWNSRPPSSSHRPSRASQSGNGGGGGGESRVATCDIHPQSGRDWGRMLCTRTSVTRGTPVGH